MIVVENGIQPGEKVVTDGQLRLVPGATVQARDRQNNPSKSGSPPTASEGSGEAKK
jgi:hypothetical protein